MWMSIIISQVTVFTEYSKRVISFQVCLSFEEEIGIAFIWLITWSKRIIGWFIPLFHGVMKSLTFAYLLIWLSVIRIVLVYLIGWSGSWPPVASSVPSLVSHHYRAQLCLWRGEWSVALIYLDPSWISC